MTLRAPRPPGASLAYPGLLAALFGYLFYARTRGVSDSFLLLADQIRDWRIALGAFGDLPLAGTPSTAGGVSLGPIYYWVLWASRVLIGPFTDNLPHAGAYGIALLQGAADLLLLDTLRRRFDSVWIATAVVLGAATVSHDLAVSATIWNPAVSVAFVKLALALRLRHGPDASLWWTAATMAAAWLAVQAHSIAVFVALPVAASYLAAPLSARRLTDALQQTRTIAEVIALLQLPFVVHLTRATPTSAPTRALADATEALASGGLRVTASLEALLEHTASIFSAPWQFTQAPLVLTACLAVALWRTRRDLALLSVTIAPLVTAVCGLALWQRHYDQYWYLPLAPCAALSVVTALTWPWPSITSAALIAVLAAVQPARLAHSHTWYRMPQYGPLVTGSKRVVARSTAVRRLETTFPMPPLSDAAYPYEAMGGRFSEEAPFDAVIDDRGHVHFRPVAR